jgi:hypothetical protein
MGRESWQQRHDYCKQDKLLVQTWGSIVAKPSSLAKLKTQMLENQAAHEFMCHANVVTFRKTAKNGPKISHFMLRK